MICWTDFIFPYKDHGKQSWNYLVPTYFLLCVTCMDTVVFLYADVGEEVGKGKLSGDHNRAVL